MTTTPVTTTPSPTTTDPKETPVQPVPAPFVLPSKAVKGELGKAVELKPAYADRIDRATIEIANADEDGKLVVPGEGTWTVDENGTFTFTPEDGFLGTPAPITYVAKDKDGNDAAAPGYIMAYYPAVAVADAIADADANPFILPSDAVNIAKGQSKVFPLVEMNNQIDPSTIKLKGATDGTLVVKGEGTWTVDTQTGTVTFTPEPNFEGTATPVTYTAASRKGVQSRYPAFLMVATEEFDPVPNLNEPKDPKGPKGPNQPPVVPTPKDDNASSQGAAGRCFGNAVRSPIAWLLPIGLLGYIGNELAAPFIGVYQEQLNQVNAELQARWNEATKDYQRDWGWGGGGRDNSRQSEAAAQLQAQINQINGQIQQIAGSPEVQQAGKVLGALVAIAAVGGLLYDWCSAEPGKAVTAIDFGNSDRKA